MGWTGVGAGPRRARPTPAAGGSGTGWPRPASTTCSRVEFVGVVGVLFVVGAALGFAIFGGAAARRSCSAPSPPASRSRPTAAGAGPGVRCAQEAWPRMIEEIRILTGALGRSIPQALFEVGRRGPVELQPAFAAAHREWLVSTDFARTVARAEGRASPTRPPTPPARRCSSPTSSAAPTSTAASRRWSRTASRTCRAARTPGRSRPACGSPAGSCSSSRSAWRSPGMSVGNGRAAYATPFGQLAVAARHRHGRRSAGCGPGRSCACPRRSGCSSR